MPDPGSMERVTLYRCENGHLDQQGWNGRRCRVCKAPTAPVEFVPLAVMERLAAENEKLRDALEWIYAEPEYPEVVQERARAALVAIDAQREASDG